MTRVIAAVLLALVWLAPSNVAGQNASIGTLRIYLARHGQSTYNVMRRITGWTDAPLTATGRRQARDLAEVLRGVDVDAVYSSTLSRSHDTALVAARGRRVTALAGLRERNWGAFTGRPANDPEFLRRRGIDGDTLDGGESKEMFYQRVRDAVAGIRRAHPTGAVLIVAHGATNQQVLRALLDLSEAEAQSIDQANDEVYALDFLDGRPPLLWKLIGEKNLSDF